MTLRRSCPHSSLHRRIAAACIVLGGLGAGALASVAAVASAAPAASSANEAQQRDFFRAVQMDDVRTVRSLLGTVDANGRDPIGGEPAVIEAVREGAQNVLTVLLADPGTKVDATAVNGNTALMMAAYKGNRPAAEALLAKGAAVNTLGWTPLHYAAAGGNDEIAALLLQRGARIDPLSPPASGANTPLMIAAREGKENSVAFLLDHGANPALFNNQGMTPAQIADKADHKSIAALLRAREAGTLNRGRRRSHAGGNPRFDRPPERAGNRSRQIRQAGFGNAQTSFPAVPGMTATS